MQPRWPLGAHMGAKTPPKTVQKQPKGHVFRLKKNVFGAKYPQVRPRTPTTTQFGAKKAHKTSPDLLWTWISIQFWMISYEILKEFSLRFASLCFPLLCLMWKTFKNALRGVSFCVFATCTSRSIWTYFWYRFCIDFHLFWFPNPSKIEPKTAKMQPRWPKSVKNRAQDGQGAAKMASWSPHGATTLPKTVQKHSKGHVLFVF